MVGRFVKNLPLILSMFALTGTIVLWYVETNEETVRRVEFSKEIEDAAIVDEDGTIVIMVDENDLAAVLDRVVETEETANNAANSADTILSFIEGGSILIGALFALAVIAFGSSIQDVRSQLEDSINDAERRFDEIEERNDSLVSQIQEQVELSVLRGQQRIEAGEKRVEGLTDEIEETVKASEDRLKNLEGIVDAALQDAKQDAENSFRVLSLLLLAEQQVRARNRKTAITTLEEAYTIDPNNQTTNYLLGYLYVGRKKFDTAIDHLQRALDSDPNFAPALAAMGLAQRRMGDTATEDLKRRQLWASAELNLSKALDSDSSLIDADNESYFGTLGGLYRRQGRLEDALKSYESAVNTTPNNSYPVINLATLYKKLGYNDQAKDMFEKAIEISEAILDDHPGDTWARLDLAQAFLIAGDSKRALDQYRNVIGRLSESGPLEVASNSLEFLRDAPQTVEGLDEVMKLLRETIQRMQGTDGDMPPRLSNAATRH